MIKDALQYLIGLGNFEVQTIGDEMYSTQQLYKIKEETPAAINLHSLSGLVDYLKSEFDYFSGSERLMIHVESPTEVVCFSSFNRDFNRNHLISTNAMLPSYNFDRWYDAEDFNIKLQSCFVGNEDKEIMLKVVGNIKEEAVNTVGDDGISQSVVAKTGIAAVDNVKVPNPVLLAPYRTFVEVDQPESDFIFRMKNGPSCALFEADGGSWKLEAMNNIKEYLAVALDKEIENGKLVIIA